MYGLSTELQNQIIELAKRYRVQKLVLFGSRARGDFRPASDIDLAVYGLDPRNDLAFSADLDELPTLLKFDMVPIRAGTDAALIAEIEKDGVVWMERALHKIQQFSQALDRLQEALSDSASSNSTVMRDGVIQRFEFTAELAWKSCREILLDEGFVNIDSPKAVMRQALASGLIADGDGWFSLLQARNITSHMYSEDQAAAIYQSIRQTYLPLFLSLKAEMAHHL
mgnify:FL=1